MRLKSLIYWNEPNGAQGRSRTTDTAIFRSGLDFWNQRLSSRKAGKTGRFPPVDGKSLYFRRASTVSSSAPRSRRHAHLAADASRPAALPMIEVDGVQNLHTLHGYRGPLGVECTCGRRGVVSAKALGPHPATCGRFAPCPSSAGNAARGSGRAGYSPRRSTRWIGQGRRRGRSLRLLQRTWAGSGPLSARFRPTNLCKGRC